MVGRTVIESVPLFAGLTPAAIQVLADQAVERRFAAGEVLYLTGGTPQGLLVIAEGRVRLVRGRGARQHVIHEEEVGGTLGEVPLFAGGTYPATAIAAEPTRCLLLSTDTLEGVLRTDPRLAFIFLQRLSLRLRDLVDRMDRLAAQSVTGRLAGLILERQRAAGDRGAFPLGRTQEEVSQELGTVREVLVRALRQLRTIGVIEAAGRGRYRVLDARRLARLADR